MYETLINYCSSFIPLSAIEKEAIELNFKHITIKRNGFLLKEGKVCDFIAFVNSGVIRHYHLKNGKEITCDITLKNSFITDFKSFTQSTPSNYNFQILKTVELYIIKKMELLELYNNYKNIESLGRMMAEQVALRAIDMAMTLSSDKPEERVEKFIIQRPDLFQEVPQRYLANLLGISAESLSRIRGRKNLNLSQQKLDSPGLNFVP